MASIAQNFLDDLNLMKDQLLKADEFNGFVLIGLFKKDKESFSLVAFDAQDPEKLLGRIELAKNDLINQYCTYRDETISSSKHTHSANEESLEKKLKNVHDLFKDFDDSTKKH